MQVSYGPKMKYICIRDLENLGVDIKFSFLSVITSQLWPKNEISVIAQLAPLSILRNMQVKSAITEIFSGVNASLTLGGTTLPFPSPLPLPPHHRRKLPPNSGGGAHGPFLPLPSFPFPSPPLPSPLPSLPPLPSPLLRSRAPKSS